MRIVEIKGNADMRVIGMTLAHKVNDQLRCAIVTDDIAYSRIGEKISDRIYRCGEIYVAIVPELFCINELDKAKMLIDVAIEDIKKTTGEESEVVLVCWNNELVTDYELKTAVALFKEGMSTRDVTEYNWVKTDSEETDYDTLRYVVFYDKKKYKNVNYEHSEKVLVTDAETKSIREMEQTGRFKAISGGYSAIANDIAGKKCGVYTGK